MTGNATAVTNGMRNATTDSLLRLGLLAGPLYIVLVLLQMFIREGFDISRHPASLLSNGDLGWIQTANFVITGLLYVLFAAGLARALAQWRGRGGTWAPRLLGVFGGAMVLAAVFPADPVDGFPPGTPVGPPTEVSTLGLLHFLVGTVSFLALIAACFAFARWFSRTGDRGWSTFSSVTGALFLASWLSLFVLQGVPAANIALALGIALAMIWTALLAGRVLRRVGGGSARSAP